MKKMQMFKSNPRKSFLIIFITFILLLGLSSTALVETDEAQDLQSLTLRESILIGLNNNLDISLAVIDYEESEKQLEKAKIVGEEELLEQAQDSYENRQEQLNHTREQIVKSIEQKFYNLIRTEENLQSQQKLLEQKQTQLEADELKYEVGLISELDIEKSRNSYQDTKDNYERSKRDLKTGYMEFNQLLGRELEKEVDLISEGVDTIEAVTMELETAYKTALDHRQDILDAKEEIDDADKNLKDVDNKYSAPVEIEKARINLKKAEINMNILKQDLKIQVRQQLFSLKDVYDSINEAEKQLQLALKEKESAELKYEAGYISTQQMLQAQDSLAEAEKKLNQAKWDYKTSRQNFFRFLGIWDIEDYIKQLKNQDENNQNNGLGDDSE